MAQLPAQPLDVSDLKPISMDNRGYWRGIDVDSTDEICGGHADSYQFYFYRVSDSSWLSMRDGDRSVSIIC